MNYTSYCHVSFLKHQPIIYNYNYDLMFSYSMRFLDEQNMC